MGFPLRILHGFSFNNALQMMPRTYNVDKGEICCTPKMIVAVAIFCLYSLAAFAQETKAPVSSPPPSTPPVPATGNEIRVELGYTATFLIKDPAQGNLYMPANDSTRNVYVTGSKMIGAQSGISARMNFELGEAKRIIVPIGMDLTFFRGQQRLENDVEIGRGAVSSNVTSIVAGAQYRFLDLPLARAFLYGGIEARGSFVQGPHFEYIVENKITGVRNDTLSQDTTIKESVFRFGGALRVGVQGRLYKQLQVNLSCAYGVINLFGRDLRTSSPDRRSDLLTPTYIGETIEHMTQFMHFSIWFQYRL